MSASFTTELSKKIGRDKKATESLLMALSQAILQHCGEMDSVAIPGFGTFEAIKHDEEYVKDHVTGHTLLLPPEIVLTFKASGRIRKLIKPGAEKEGAL